MESVSIWRKNSNTIKIFKTTLLVFFILLVSFILFKPNTTHAQSPFYGVGPLPYMELHTESIENITQDSAKIIWFTSHGSTSKVVYNTTSMPSNKLKSDDNLGYSYTSETLTENITYHELILSNLDSETTYFIRAISQPNQEKWPGSKAIYSKELQFTTKQAPILDVSDGIGGPDEEVNGDDKVWYPKAKSDTTDEGEILGEEIDDATSTEEVFEEVSDPIGTVDEAESQNPKGFKEWAKELFWWIVLAIVAGILIYAIPEKKEK